MWQLRKEITISMDLIWRTLTVVLVLLAPELNAANSSSVLSGFASSVLPSISLSTSTLYPSIQDLTSSTNGGFATAERSTKLANNDTSSAQLPSVATLSLSSISSILKTETSVLSISETRTIINHTTTVPLGSSQSVSASQTNIDVVMSTVSSNYSSNISAPSSSFVNPNSSSTVMVLSEVRTSTASSLQTSLMSPQGSVSANITHLTPVVSLAANLSGSVSATRTLSSAIAKATPSQSHLSHTVTINGSSTGSPSQSIAGSLTLQLETSRMVSSSSVAMVTNRTLSTSYLPSSVVINASKTAIESSSTLGVSAVISASTSTKSILDSKVASVNGTVAVTSTTIHETPVLVTVNSSVHAVNATPTTVLNGTVAVTSTTIHETPVLVTANSSVHAVNATPTTVLTSKATISPTHSADTTRLSTFQSRSSVVNSTLQTSTVLSSVGLVVNQTRSVADSSASSPARSIPSLNQTVSAVKTSALLQSTRALLNTSLVPTSSSVGIGGEASSLVASPNATSQSSTSVSLHPSTVAAPSSTASIGVVSSIAEEKTSSVSSTVAVSSRLPVSTSVSLHTSPMATSSSVQVGVVSSMATATSESPSSTPLVVSSRLQNVTSQSSLSGRLTPSSKTATPSRSSVETVASPAASVTPNKTSTDEGFIVTSYSTPCYIYYVVEKTVFPVATANHSAVPSTTSTTPKITLDIGTATRLHSGLPTVTLTHTVGMTTQVSKMQSQMPGSTDAITSSSGLVGESVKSSRFIEATSTSTHLSSKTSISPSETVTEVLGADTSKVVQTDSSTVPSVMSPSVSSSITSDSRNTTDASTFQTSTLLPQVQSTPSQSGTLAIPRVTTSVMGLQSTSMTNKTLGSSPTILPGSFTPVVANASVSETHNMSTAIATGALSSTKQESLQSTHGSSSIVFTSSVESRAFVPTVAPSLPSQNVSSARTVSGVSQVISTDNTPVTTQASDGSVLTSKSGSIIQATASSEIHLPTTVISVSQLVTEMPSNATLSSTEIITSSESQVASSPARHTSVIGSSHVLLLNTTRLSQMPSPTSIRNLLSVVANETTTKSVSSSPVLLSSLATVSQNRTLSTVSLSAIGSSKNGSSVGSVEQISSLAQSSSMSQLAVLSSSSVQMLPSSDTHASPSTSPVMETLSTIVPQVSAMSTQITSSSPSPAGNKTTASSIEMVPSSAAIHPASNTSSSVGGPLSSVMLSQAGTASTPTSNNTQVAPSSSLSQAGNKTSASSTQMLPSSSIHMLPSVNTSTGEPLLSAMLSLSTTVSQAGGMSVPVNSSLHVAVSSSYSQADNTSSAAEPLPSSASSSALPPVRRKKRAVVDPSNATSVIESSSSAMLTSSVGKTVVLTSQHSSAVAVILPSSLVASQTSQISNSVMQTAEAGSSHGLVPTSMLGSSGQPLSVSESLSSRSVSASLNSSKQAASPSLLEGNVTQTAVLPSGSPSTGSASEKKPTSNTTSSSLSVVMTTGSATSSFHLSPSQHANVTESHAGSITRSPSSAPLFVSITPSGTLTQSHVMLVPSSLSKESSVPQGNMTASLSVTNVVGIVTSTGVVPSTQVSLPTTSVSSSEQSSSVGVVVSSTFVSNGSSLDLKPSASAVLDNATSTLEHSVTSVSSSVQSSSVGVVVSSTSVDNGTLPSTSSLDLKSSVSIVLGNSTSTLTHSVTSVSSSVQSSSVGVVVSSTFVDSGTLPSTSSLGNSTSTLAHSLTSVSSSVQSSSLGMVVSSTFVVNETLPLTSSLDLKSSPSTLLSNSTSTLTHSVKSVSTSIQSSSTFGDNSTLPSTSSLDLMMSSAVLGKSSSILAHSTTARSQPSTVFGNASVAVSSSSLSPGTSSSFVVVVPTASSVSLGKGSSSLTPLESSVTISSSPLPTKIRNFSLSSTASSSPLSNMSVMSTALQNASDTSRLFIPPSSAHLSSPTTDLTSQAVSRSVVTHPSPSAVESSEVLQTIVSSSVTVASSSRLYRPPLVTISSLGICYVVYTTRIVQPSLVSTRPVNMSSTASVNVSSTRGFSVVMNTTSIQVSPSVSLNSSSAVVQPTLDVNATRSQSSRVVSTAVHVNFTVKPSGSSSSVQISSTVPIVNSITSLPVSASSVSKSVEVTQSSNVSQSTSSASSSTSQIISVAFTTLPSIKETSSLATSTYLLSKTPSISTTEVLSSSQAPTSQVISPSRTVSQVVSSSTTVPTTQPPDPSLLMDTVLIVPQVMDVQSEEFRKELEVNLAEAYSFAELRRRKRATMDINATIDSIQRVNNGDNVNVAFFITKDDQRLSGFDAAQNYEKFSKAELGNLIKFDVVSMPRALVVPPTPTLQPNILVSLIIKASASGNISVPENKKRLEDNLAAFYKENKQLTTTVTANIKTIIHEPNEIDYLEFYISVSGQEVNASDVVQTFKVPHVNLLTAQLEVEVLVQAYIPDSLTATEADYVIIGMSVPENLVLTSASFRSDLGNKLVTVYQKGKGTKNARRKKRSGSTSATITEIARKADSTASEAAVTFFVFDAGKVTNASYVVSVMNRLSTSEMTTFTRPYAVLSAPKRAIVPPTPTDVTTTVAATPIKWWIIPAVILPILLIIVIILLVCWRWKKGAPKSKVEPDTIRMLDTDKRKPVHGFDVARFTEPGVSGMKTTAFMTRSPTSDVDDEEAAVKPVTRETSLRRKVAKRPIQKLPAREQRQTNLAYEEEEEEEEEESEVSVTPTGSTQALTRGRTPAKPPSATRKTPAKPQRPVEPSEMDSEEDSELSESESEPESVAQPEQTRHSAAQVPTVAVMSEASGPPRYPPVRFRSSVHPAPSLPPLNAKQTSLVGVKVEPPSEDDSTRGRRRKGKVTKRELEQRADLERQKNKQRLRDRKRDASYSPRTAVPVERKAWDRAQHDFDDVLEEEEAERVITGKKRKTRRRRPPSSSVATDEEGMPHLKSYRKLKSPKTTSSASTRGRDKKRGKPADSVSNASSDDESEIDMTETRRRMHAMLDDAFSLFGPQFSKQLGIDPEGQPAHPEVRPEAYPATPGRPAVIPRYIGGQPALPEPPPAHGRATEPTARQRRRVQPAMPGYPAGMPQTPIGMPGYPGRPPMRPPIVTRDPIVVWDPADRQRILNQRAPPPTYAYRDPSGQNLYITSVQQQRDDMGGLVWSPYAAEDSMDALYPDLAQANYPGALGTSPPKDTSFLSYLQAAPPHDTVLNMSANSTLDQRGASLGQSPQPLIKSIKDELFRLSQGASRKTPITEL